MGDTAAPEIPRVFVDTVILKYAKDRLDRLFLANESINWGGQMFSVPVHSPGTLLPNRKLEVDQYRESELLRPIAELAKLGRIEILVGREVIFESLRRRNMDGGDGHFYGAPVTTVAPPFQYGRVIVGGQETQVDFVKSLRIPRLDQLAVACGAMQGKTINANQLMDAFHVYCAEAANATHFLTADRGLVNLIKHHRRFPPRVKAVLPSQLLNELEAMPEGMAS